MGESRGEGVVSDAFGRLESFWRAVGASFLGGWLVVENASKNCLFSRDPERPLDIERPRNWGSFGAELNGLKLWRRGGNSASGGACRSRKGRFGLLGERDLDREEVL